MGPSAEPHSATEVQSVAPELSVAETDPRCHPAFNGRAMTRRRSNNVLPQMLTHAVKVQHARDRPHGCLDFVLHGFRCDGPVAVGARFTRTVVNGEGQNSGAIVDARGPDKLRSINPRARAHAMTPREDEE